jgi:NhaP-type Na+/H+ or K+/H+ antiporter
LIFLGVLILLFRRLPVIFAMHWKIRQIEEMQQALFVGFFGPIGVSSVFYLYVSIDFLDTITVNGAIREDAARLKDVMRIVVWFLAICSIVSVLSIGGTASSLVLMLTGRAWAQHSCWEGWLSPSENNLECH